MLKTNTRTLADNEMNAIVETLDEIFMNHDVVDVDTSIIPPLIQYMNDVYIGKETTAVIIGRVANILKHEKNIEDIYNRNRPPISWRLELTSILSTDEFNKLESVIEPKKYEGIISDQVNDNTWCVIDFNSKEIYQRRQNKSKEDTVTFVLKCVPKEVVIYDTVLLDQPRSFKITWTSNLSNRNFTTQGEAGGATIKEISEYLTNAGFSPNPRLVEGAVSSTINAFINEGLANIQEDIDNPGFYYNIEDDKILAVKKELYEPSDDELNRGLDVLEELAKHFKDNEDILATIIKYGLIAPFSYAKKQTGHWLPWLYLKGSAGSGKTTIAKLLLYLHGEPSPENNIGGSGFDTQARVGAKLSKSCDPIIVNEPAGAFGRPSVVELIKVAVESTICRGKMIGGSYRQIPAFAPVIFTANQYLPEDDALLRRFYVLSFSYSMRKTEEEKIAFENTFHIDTPKISPLKNLKFIGDFVINEIMYNPSILMDDWRECIDSLLNRLYSDIGRDIPDWIVSWRESENLDDFDNTQIEDIRNFFNEEFNKARKKITIYNENGYPVESLTNYDDVNTSEDFEDINWNIVNNRELNWAIPKLSKNNTRYVCFTQGLRKAIANRIDFCSDLKSIGELLGWKYQTVNFGDNQRMMCLKVKFDDFLEFMYPSVVFEEDDIE